jgi:hypothetical protein
VLASSPWYAAGPFWEFAQDGLDPECPHTRIFRWKTADAPWISPLVVGTARETMSPDQFAAEYEGEFIPPENRAA